MVTRPIHIQRSARRDKTIRHLLPPEPRTKRKERCPSGRGCPVGVAPDDLIIAETAPSKVQRAPPMIAIRKYRSTICFMRAQVHLIAVYENELAFTIT